MTAKPRAFQQATIRAAVRSLSDKKGTRRFLVADEAGLGKTVVARGVLEQMSCDQPQPLCVFYVCSNQAIARQNLEELVRFLPENEQEGALADVDRPSLLPAGKRPTCRRLHVYALTPGTALPGRGGRSSRGRVEERALIDVLLNTLLQSKVRGLHPVLRSGVSPATYGSWVRWYRAQVREKTLRIDAFMPIWRTELERVFDVRSGGDLLGGMAAACNGNRRQNPGLLIAKLRGSVASAALSSVRPDIVIFDEFQRFRDLLDERSDTDESEADAISNRVLSAVLGEDPLSAPALLLLSATPYTPYRSRQGVGDHADLTNDFFDLIGFLAGGGELGREATAAAKCRFGVLEEELRKGTPHSPRARTARSELQTSLCRVMSRTERSHAALPGGEVGAHMCEVEAPLQLADLMTFQHLARSLSPAGDLGWTLPFWQSVPLPMQTLGARYKAWRDADRNQKAGANTVLSKSDRDQYRSPAPWPHPRLRALLRILPVSQLSLPWLRPSLPWWPLSGPWAGTPKEDGVDGKALIFSQYLAVPSALAGVLSYAVEAKWNNRRKAGQADAYQAAASLSRLDARADRPQLLELFHPSPLLAALDPLSALGTDGLKPKAAVQSQLKERLTALGIRAKPDGARGRVVLKAWQLVAMIERRMGEWETSERALRTVASRSSRAGSTEEDPKEPGKALHAMLDRWQEATRLDIVELDDDQEFNQLVDLAMDSPGVVFARAVARHWPEALQTLENRTLLADIAWRGLRSYFDAPWFVALLDGGRGGTYPTSLRKAVRDGNFESVLDEHLWYLSTRAGSWPERLESLETALRIRNTRVVFHELGRGGDFFTVRCHAASALTEAKVRSQMPAGSVGEEPSIPDRPEDVRKAFNSPFWPHVLVTTSVGQEGLDFHPWCRTLLHWDLCSGPVDLEQRDGRVNRFAGLAIRRAIAERLAKTVKQSNGASSPWVRLAQLADASMSDPSGLQPWWVAPGAETKSLYFAAPGSAVQFRAAALTNERALYRLVLGMPNQADLLEHVAANGSVDLESLHDACLDLAAFSLEGR